MRAMFSFLQPIFTALLECIYPPVCGVCGKVGEKWICNKCLHNIQAKAENRRRGYLTASYEDGFFLLSYHRDEIKKMLLSYKFYQLAYLYRTFVKIILKNEKACRFLKKYDIMIPVPIHNNRKRKRGYNQSELIAKEIGKKLNIPVISNCLVKIKNVVPQSTLNKEQRKQNIKGVYQVKKEETIKGKRIVLVDDIFTTGSTLEECSKMLKQAGASKIGIFTIAKD